MVENYNNEFDWVPSLRKVIVTNRGKWYPSNLKAMVDLEVTGAQEFIERYGEYWWVSSTFNKWTEENGNNMDYFLYLGIPNLMKPETGDICYMLDKPYIQGAEHIYKLVHEKTGKEFIIGGEGFKIMED